MQAWYRCLIMEGFVRLWLCCVHTFVWSPLWDASHDLLCSCFIACFLFVCNFMSLLVCSLCTLNKSIVTARVSRQGTSILSPVIPFSFVVVPAFIIFQKSESQVYENHPALYILAFGMVAAKVTNRLVVSVTFMWDYKYTVCYKFTRKFGVAM